MYKRPARVVFLEDPVVGLAQIAAAWAAHLAAEWMEAHAAGWGEERPSAAAPAIMAESGLILPERCVPTRPLLAWADLLVPLTPAAVVRCVDPPPGVQVKPWLMEVPEHADAAAWRELAEQLHRRVAGMAGGMRMLAGKAPTSDAKRTRGPRAAE